MYNNMHTHDSPSEDLLTSLTIVTAETFSGDQEECLLFEDGRLLLLSL